MKIVIGIDGSGESVHAAEFLAGIPLPKGSEVRVVTALVDSQFDLVASETGVQLREAEKEVAQSAYRQAQAVLEAAGLECEHVLEVGHPQKLLLSVAKDHDCDLMVVGARGHSAVHRALLGSTADYVANHAGCSTLVVRPGVEAVAEGALPKAETPARLMIAYDGSDLAKVALRQAHELEWVPTTSVKVAMMLERPKLIPEDVVYDPSTIAEKKLELDGVLKAMCSECDCSFVVKESLHTGAGLCRLAETEETDLMFMGGTGKSAIARFFLGSESRYVLHHSPCSLWIARPKQWSK